MDINIYKENTINELGLKEEINNMITLLNEEGLEDIAKNLKEDLNNIINHK